MEAPSLVTSAVIEPKAARIMQRGEQAGSQRDKNETSALSQSVTTDPFGHIPALVVAIRRVERMLTREVPPFNLSRLQETAVRCKEG